MTTTWSTTAKNANVTLSNGNLTATASGFFCGRTDLFVTAGQKRTIEFTFTAVGDPTGGGVCNASASLADGRFIGDALTGTGHYEDGHCWKAFLIVEELSTFGAGDVVGVHVEGGNKVWWSKNGVFDNGDNPATNTGGVDISGMGDVAFAYVVNGPLTANFGATPLAFAPPAGFTTPDQLPVVATVSGGGVRRQRELLEPDDELLKLFGQAEEVVEPPKPPSRKQRKRMKVAAKKAAVAPVVDDEEEEAAMLLLAA